MGDPKPKLRTETEIRKRLQRLEGARKQSIANYVQIYTLKWVLGEVDD